LARASAFAKIHRKKISTVSPLLGFLWKKTMELAFEHMATYGAILARYGAGF